MATRREDTGAARPSRLLDVGSLADRLIAGDRRTLAKAITLVESSLPAHAAAAQELVERVLPVTGRGLRLGVTGVPGAGKSTFIEALGLRVIDDGHRVAVLAVDPSSALSGGSLLGDKTRMRRLGVSAGAFIRPSPAGGTLGGVAARTREAMVLCEAAGYDVVIVETVGVGQGEYAVASMVDCFLVLMLAGAGDELQGLKKGILELADAVVINKADGDNVARAALAQAQCASALRLTRHAADGTEFPVLTASALEGTGLDALWTLIRERHRAGLADGTVERRRSLQRRAWFWTLVEQGLKERFLAPPAVRAEVARLMRAVESRLITPTRAARDLLALP